MKKIVKIFFFALVVKPLVLFILGLNKRGQNNLPVKGPAIIAANHNSHLDTLVLMSLFPIAKIHKIRPVAAADYFLRSSFMKWFSTYCIDIIPLDRKNRVNKKALFAECHKALDNGDILILFPEGSRGTPEQMSQLKKGVFYLVKDRDDTQVTPVVLRGLGRALPKGTALFVPFNCDVVIGQPVPAEEKADDFIKLLASRYDNLFQYCVTHQEPEQ